MCYSIRALYLYTRYIIRALYYTCVILYMRYIIHALYYTRVILYMRYTIHALYYIFALYWRFVSTAAATTTFM